MLVKKENLVAQKLKNSCYKNGKEKDPRKCAKFLHELGLVYRERFLSSESLNEKIYNRKMCVMQCTILLNAAIVRNPENKDQVERDLCQFCFELLEISTAKNKDSDLIMVTNKIKTSIQTMRENIAELSRKIKIIPKDAEGITFELLKKEKIKNIKEIQTEVSETFKNIMQDLCRLCIKIMGNPPCRFALVGLGSLARKEITPYSDFEHIIVLEDGLKDYENVKKYFRWFALIFQVVLINLGETIVPCADIPSINGGEHSVFKFFDGNTPRGVSPDGMVPYACKNPLGRMFETENKKFTLELIQPVSIMASFIDSEEDIKNGYHLAEMLTMACYVAGDIGIYKEFDDLAKQRLQPIKENVFLTSNQKELIANFKQFSVWESFGIKKRSDEYILSVKRMVYRSSTLFISAFGRQHGIEAASCFDIVKELVNANLFHSSDKIIFEFAIAVACETRLKICIKNNSQNEKVESLQANSEVIEEVGIKSILEYFICVYNLQYKALILTEDPRLAKYMNKHNFKPMKDPNSENVLRLMILYYLNQYENVIQLALELLQESENPLYYDHIANSYSQLRENNKAITYYEKMLKLDLLDLTRAHITSCIGSCYYDLHRFSEGLQYQEEALEMYFLLYQAPEIASCYKLIANCKVGLKLYLDASEYFEKSLNMFQKLSSLNTQINYDEDIANLYIRCANCKLSVRLYNQASNYFQKGVEMLEKRSQNQATDVKLAKVYLDYGTCRSSLTYNKEALVLFDKALEIFNNAPKLTKTMDKARVYMEIGQCKFELGLYHEALKYFRISQTSFETITPDEIHRGRLVQNYLNIGRTLAQQNSHKEAFEYFDKAFEITKSNCNVHFSFDIVPSKTMKKEETQPFMSTTDPLKEPQVNKPIEINQNVNDQMAYLLQYLGNNTLSKENYKDALNYFLKSVEVFEHSSSTIVDQTQLETKAKVWSLIGRCYGCMYLYTQAFEALNKAIKMFETLTLPPASDVLVAYINLADLKKSTGLEIESIGCYQKAIDIINQNKIPVTKFRIATIYEKVGEMQYRNQLHKDSTLSFENALQLCMDITEDESTDILIATTCTKLGAAYYYSGQTTKATACFQRSQDIFHKGGVILSKAYELNCKLLDLATSKLFFEFITNFCVYK